MTAVQYLTWAFAIAAIVASVAVLSSRAAYSKDSALKSVILLTVVIHVFLFYLCLFLVKVEGNVALEHFLQAALDDQRPFEVWSTALRLHTILAILNKEVVSYYTEKIIKKGGRP